MVASLLPSLFLVAHRLCTRPGDHSLLQVHRDHVAMAADGLGIDYTVHWDGILNR